MTRLLIVEDGPDIAPLLLQFARLAGVEAEHAATGAEAMALYWKAVADGRPFAGILLDLALPGMDGLSVAERVRGIEDEGIAPKASIYSLTGYGEHLISPESLRRARFDFLRTKPADEVELKAWMQSLNGSKG